MNTFSDAVSPRAEPPHVGLPPAESAMDEQVGSGAQDAETPSRLDIAREESGPTPGAVVGGLAAATIAVAVLLWVFVLSSFYIPTTSMVPTLVEGDRVVVNELSYQWGDVERGQVIVFDPPAASDVDFTLTKRVVALPGETVRIVDGEVFIGDLLMIEPYLLEPSSTEPDQLIPGCEQSAPAARECVVPADHVFVMGDNRRDSSDSRSFGPIAVESIVGRAFVRVWPLDSIGRL